MVLLNYNGLVVLRFLAIIQVIWFHIALVPGLYSKPSKYIMFTVFSVFSKTNNFHFMLISSYFFIKSKYRISKCMFIIIQAIFYSVFDYLNGIIFFNFHKFDIVNLVKAFLPQAFNTFWYILPFLVSQFLQNLMNNSFQKLALFPLLIIVFVFIGLYSLPDIGLYIGTGLEYKPSCKMGAFLVTYFISSFIRLHVNVVNLKKPLLFLVYLLLFIYNVIIHQNRIHSNKLLIILFSKTWIMNLPSLLFSIPSFLIFLSLNINFKYINLIKHISQLSFGIYLCHCSHNHIQYWTILNSEHINSNFFWVYATKITGKIFFVCAIIELIRLKFINFLLFERKFYQDFSSILDNFFN